MSQWKKNEIPYHIHHSYSLYLIAVRQLERQRATYDSSEFTYVPSKSSDQPTSESDMSDEDEEQAVIDSLPTATNGVGLRKTVQVNGRKLKTGAYNGKGGY